MKSLIGSPALMAAMTSSVSNAFGMTPRSFLIFSSSLFLQLMEAGMLLK